MMKKYTFEKLDVWQKSRILVKRIYEITKSFPDEEKFGLTSQIRRASISISSNLAEGSSRQSFKDQAKFSIISYGSLMEVLNQLILANDLDFISLDKLQETRPLIEEISNKLDKLTKSQQSRHTNHQTS